MKEHGGKGMTNETNIHGMPKFSEDVQPRITVAHVYTVDCPGVRSRIENLALGTALQL